MTQIMVAKSMNSAVKANYVFQACKADVFAFRCLYNAVIVISVMTLS